MAGLEQNQPSGIEGSLTNPQVHSTSAKTPAHPDVLGQHGDGHVLTVNHQGGMGLRNTLNLT